MPRTPKLRTVEFEVDDTQGFATVVFVMSDGNRFAQYTIPFVPDGEYSPEGYYNRSDAVSLIKGMANVAGIAVSLAR